MDKRLGMEVINKNKVEITAHINLVAEDDWNEKSEK